MLRLCRSFRPAFVGLHPLGGPRSRVPRRSPATAAATPYKPPSEEIASEGLPSEVRQRAETAILKRGGAVTVGDVAAVAGISLKEAEDALRALASDSLANLKVSDEGEILYSFDPNFRDRIRNKSLRIRLESTAAAVKDTASYLARVTFGTALLASVVTVALAITVIASSGNQSNDRDRRGNGGYYRGGPQFYFNITDLLWYWNPRYSRARQPSAAKGQGGMNFLEAIFSFVFGDPDPNIAFEAQRWEKIGQYIQSRGGVVAAEELAPMLEGQVGNTTSIAVDESYVLPVLTRFGGSPVVGQDGEILYHFPNLQQTAAAQRLPAVQPKLVQERPVQLTQANGGQKLVAIALGAANLVGVVALGGMLGSPHGYYALARNGLGWIPNAMPFLQAYAFSFFAIPALRALSLRARNAGIEARNQARLAASRRLRAPDPQLATKLRAAQVEAQQRSFQRDRVVYATDTPLPTSSRDEPDEWEARLAARQAARGRGAGGRRGVPEQRRGAEDPVMDRKGGSQQQRGRDLPSWLRER